MGSGPNARGTRTDGTFSTKRARPGARRDQLMRAIIKAMQVLAARRRQPASDQALAPYATALAGVPERDALAAIKRAGRECRRFPTPRDVLCRVPGTKRRQPFPDDPPAPTPAERARVRALAAAYLARHGLAPAARPRS
jgi:hypothetical protein